jgi:two-component system CitB family sensor kinase
VALVSVGRSITAVARALERQVPLVLGTAAVALLLAAAGSWLVSRWLRRSTHDLGPAELSRMYEYYDAVLHAVREGLLLLDREGRVQLVNDEARRLLALPAQVHGRRVDDIGLPAVLGEALAEGVPRDDEIHLTADRVVVVSQGTARSAGGARMGTARSAGGARMGTARSAGGGRTGSARWAGRHLGTVVTLRDHTELRELVSELQTVRGFAESLHAQAHEAANQLHTVVSLIELGRAEEALEYATTELTVSQHLTDAVVDGIAVPELAALVVGKAAAAGERGVDLVVDEGCRVPAGVADPRDLVTIVGNLLDNAVDAAHDAPAPRWVRFGAGVVNGALEMRVRDSGPGVPAEDAERAFERGFSTKESRDGLGRGLGLALAQRAAQRHGGGVRLAGPAEFAVRLPLVRA